MTQPVINVVAAQGARQRSGQVQLFEGAVRAGQQTDAVRTMVGLDLFQAVGHVFECGLPVHRLPQPALLEHGSCQALVTAQGFVGETVAVSNPAFVDVFIFKRHHTHDLVVLDLNNQVGTRRIVWADRPAARQLPGAGAVAERFAGQRAHRANVDHVAGQLGVDRHADEGFNLRMFATVRHTKLHHAGDFLAKTHATRAVDAAAHLFHRDQWADILVKNHTFFFFVTRPAAAITHRQVLQLTLSALVTNWAIERVIDQQKLHHALLGLDGFVALGVHDHALRHGCGAGRHGLGGLFNINQAHAAVGRNAELFVITKMRNVGARLFGRMHHRAAFKHFYFLTVELNFNHGEFFAS